MDEKSPQFRFSVSPWIVLTVASYLGYFLSLEAMRNKTKVVFFVKISFIHSFEYFQVVQLIAIYLLSTPFDLKSYIVNNLNLDEPNWRYSIHMAPPGDYLVEYIFVRRLVSSTLLGRRIGRAEVLYCNIDLVHILGILMELGVSSKFLL